jgi:hypothetical protein
MKTPGMVLLLVAIIVMGGCGGGGSAVRAPAPGPNPFAVLDAYGEWLTVAPYGQVWQPRVAYDWQPFLDGDWVWTDHGWLWHSEEPFGWVVYHYGYWVDDGASGWLWVPGREWSPARVRWVVREDMIGWAPMPPPGWNLPVAVESRAWVAVDSHHFTERNIGRYRTASPIADPGRSADGRVPPDPRFVERMTHGRVEPVRTETEHVGRGEQQILKVGVVRPAEPPPQSSVPISNSAPVVVVPLPDARPQGGSTGDKAVAGRPERKLSGRGGTISPGASTTVAPPKTPAHTEKPRPVKTDPLPHPKKPERVKPPTGKKPESGKNIRKGTGRQETK